MTGRQDTESAVGARDAERQWDRTGEAARAANVDRTGVGGWSGRMARPWRVLAVDADPEVADPHIAGVTFVNAAVCAADELPPDGAGWGYSGRLGLPEPRHGVRRIIHSLQRAPHQCL